MRSSLILLAALIASQHITIYLNTGIYVSLVAVLVFAIGFLFQKANLMLIGLLHFLIYFVGPRVIPEPWYGIPGIAYLLPLGTTLSIAFFWKKTRSTLSWLRLGKSDRTAWLILIATILISSIALIAWGFRQNDLGEWEEMSKELANFSPWLRFGVVIPLLAALNAFTEEGVFRGVLLESLLASGGNKTVALFLQAMAFASIHYTGGFPSGYVGYLMTLMYGLSLGYLRIRTQGLRTPLLTHFFADIIIYSLVSLK